ncbi:putative Ig domain-containing protein, partial [Staphylococcus aureus]|nr:putative Ig domain-containing protein [Staphylococcus aureus]
TLGTPYSQALSASGGTAPYNYTVSSGALPTGLSLSTGGVITGTPTALGNYTFTINALDQTTGLGPFNGSNNYILSILFAP